MEWAREKALSVDIAMRRLVKEPGPLVHTRRSRSLTSRLFAFSSLISYYSMSEANLRFIKDSKKGLFILRVVVVLAVFIACIIPVSMVWNLMDLFMAVMAILNIYALFHLYKYVVAAHDDYRKQKDAGVDVPEFFVDNIKDSGLDTSGITVWDKE